MGWGGTDGRERAWGGSGWRGVGSGEWEVDARNFTDSDAADGELNRQFFFIARRRRASPWEIQQPTTNKQNFGSTFMYIFGGLFLRILYF